MEVLGIPPDHVLQVASRTKKFFEKGPSGNWMMRRSREGRKVRMPSCQQFWTVALWQVLDQIYVPSIFDFVLQDVFRRPGSRSLGDILGVDTGGPGSIRQGEVGHSPSDYRKFKDLILRMLDYDPEMRIKPYDGLQHPFFRRENSSMATSTHSSSTVSSRSAHDIALTDSGKNGPINVPIASQSSSYSLSSSTTDSLAGEMGTHYRIPATADLYHGQQAHHSSSSQSIPKYGDFSQGPPQAVQDPMMGRTNIPMPLPPGSVAHGPYPMMDGSSVTLTPLSPPQPSQGDGIVPTIEIPYAHHGGYTHGYHQNMAVSTDNMLSSTKLPYNSGYSAQNGALPFYGTNQLFPDVASEPFHFKFGTSSSHGGQGAMLQNSPNNPHHNPFHYQPPNPHNGLSGSPISKPLKSEHRHASHLSSPQTTTNQNGRRESHDSPMTGVVIQQ